MKRLILIILCLSMLVTGGCSCYRLEWNLHPSDPQNPQGNTEATPAVNGAQETPAPTAESIMDIPLYTPAQEPPTPYHPDLSVLPIEFIVKDEVSWDANEATMFRYDMDFDGNEEMISYVCDEQEYTTTIRIGSKSVKLDGYNLNRVLLIDLDPATPYVNLLVCIDGASEDYMTTELHYQNGLIIRGKMVESYCSWDDSTEKLMFYEDCDILGTLVGERSYSGEDLKPDSNWLNVSYRITEDDLRNDRDELIEFGRLLHVRRDLPCEINGSPSKIAKGSYVYLVRYNDTFDTAEIRTEDGISATLHFTYHDWEFYIEDKPVSKYFDNLFYAG